MENPIQGVPQKQKKQKNKGFAKPVQNAQANPQAVGGTVPQAQGQQAQQSKPQAV
jgi:hypothetical protein